MGSTANSLTLLHFLLIGFSLSFSFLFYFFCCHSLSHYWLYQDSSFYFSLYSQILTHLIAQSFHHGLCSSRNLQELVRINERREKGLRLWCEDIYTLDYICDKEPMWITHHQNMLKMRKSLMLLNSTMRMERVMILKTSLGPASEMKILREFWWNKRKWWGRNWERESSIWFGRTCCWRTCISWIELQ